MKTRAILLLAIGLLFAVCPDVASQVSDVADPDGSPEAPYRIPEVASRVTTDGVLDEDVWPHALVLDLAYETHPGENVAPPAKTEVLLAYSRTHLYAAFRAYDPDPSAICATMCDRDHMYDDDRVVIILDTLNDHRRGYMLFCNPFGIQGDALDWSGEGAGDPSWDAIWDSGGRITDEGYVVEMAIPFSSLRFQRTEGEQTWGIGVGRKYSRGFDYRMAVRPRDRNNSCYLCQVSKVRGFAGVTPGKHIELDLTTSGLVTQEREAFPEGSFVRRDREVEPGITARWGVTPNLVLSGAINPDFSQVEADAFQLDVNAQFALYYEEKRPLFLEGTELFRSSLDPVYTRSIVDPKWGVKLTGKEGANGVGMFLIRDEVTNLLIPGSEGSWSTSLDSENTAAVVRYRRDIGSASTLGAIMTSREADGYRSRLGGLDGNLFLTPTDKVEFQALASETSYPAELAEAVGQPPRGHDAAAYDFEYRHDTSSFDWWVGYRDIGPGFRADLGFRPQSDIRQARTGWSHTWRAEAGHWYTSLNGGFGYVYDTNRDGDLLEKFVDYWFNYEGPSRSFLNIYGIIGKDSFGGVEYDDRHVWFESGFWPAGTTLLRLNGLIGDGIDYRHGRAADRLQLSPLVQAKLWRRLDLTAAHTYERLDVDGGRLYTANISYVRGAYQFTRRAFLRAIVQYGHTNLNPFLYEDDVSSVEEVLSSQLLFSYKINPQTVLYLGYSDNHLGSDVTDLTQADRTFFAKVGYAWVL